MLALAVSGLHSQLILFEDHGNYRLLGETLDDAVGEAFDKVARMLGLPYPGGPAISQVAVHGDPHAYQLPIAKLNGPYDFSFSGLKTAVLRAIQRQVGVGHDFPSHQLPARLDALQQANFAASFQYTAVKTLVAATVRAAEEYAPASVVIAGGVAANGELRRQLSARLPLPIDYAPIELCTDNGAMIAALGYYQARLIPPTPVDEISVQPTLSMHHTAWAPPKASGAAVAAGA
jgi:N6-L-threonylcarbamoyladenine synthase